MPVLNIHERVLNAPASEVGKLIDGLASTDGQLWPHVRWHAMKFDRPLRVGAIGGHGPIRYFVESYVPGRNIHFRFTEPKGFLGSHRFEIEEVSKDKTRLRHVIEMHLKGWGRLQWPLIVRWLHDALMEDALDKAEIFAGGQPSPRHWSLWVRFLRKALKPRSSVK